VDVDLRLVRYFTVVAEHGNFHRAAAALRTAQPSLSRQIRRLEKDLGVPLFERTTRGSRLTAAGEAFLPEAMGLLRAAERAAATARAAGGPARLTVGYTGNLIVTAAVRALRETGADVQARHVESADVGAILRDHRVDVVVARQPVVTAGLHVEDLFEHPRVLIVPRSHRLAGRERVTLADFADEPLVRHPDPAMDAFWRVDPRPDGRPAPAGPMVADVTDKLELVAGGDALTMAPAGDDRALRHDLVAVPVEGLEPCRVVLAARHGDDNPLIKAFRDVAGPPRPLPRLDGPARLRR
jgi:DNA-binding transcriptional LysR family regulator